MDEYWDTWAVVHNGYIHKEYRVEMDAIDEVLRLRQKFPEKKLRIVHTVKAGCGNVRLKQLDMMYFALD